jgi:DNA mismatch repair protein MLH1
MGKLMYVKLNLLNLCWCSQNPLPVYEMACMALDDAESGWTEVDGPKTELAQSVQELLIEKAPMLDEYFSTVIDSDGNLCSLPLLLGVSHCYTQMCR